jgi:hypothetical protein
MAVQGQCKSRQGVRLSAAAHRSAHRASLDSVGTTPLAGWHRTRCCCPVAIHLRSQRKAPPDVVAARSLAFILPEFTTERTPALAQLTLVLHAARRAVPLHPLSGQVNDANGLCTWLQERAELCPLTHHQQRVRVYGCIMSEVSCTKICTMCICTQFAATPCMTQARPATHKGLGSPWRLPSAPEWIALCGREI